MRREKLREISIVVGQENAFTIKYKLNINDKQVDDSSAEFVAVGEQIASSPVVTGVESYIYPLHGIFMKKIARDILNTNINQTTKTPDDWELGAISYGVCEHAKLYKISMRTTTAGIIIHSINAQGLLGFDIQDSSGKSLTNHPDICDYFFFMKEAPLTGFVMGEVEDFTVYLPKDSAFTIFLVIEDCATITKIGSITMIEPELDTYLQ